MKGHQGVEAIREGDGAMRRGAADRMVFQGKKKAAGRSRLPLATGKDQMPMRRRI